MVGFSAFEHLPLEIGDAAKRLRPIEVSIGKVLEQSVDLTRHCADLRRGLGGPNDGIDFSAIPIEVVRVQQERRQTLDLGHEQGSLDLKKRCQHKNRRQ